MSTGLLGLAYRDDHPDTPATDRGFFYIVGGIAYFKNAAGDEVELGSSSVDWANPGTIGSGTPNTGAFTTLEAASAEISGSVGIGGAPDASALLDVSSTAKGFLPPRMNTTQRDAISSPANGMIIYNTTTHKHNVRHNGAWVEIGASSSGAMTELVANTILGGSSANVDLTSISGSYDHLKLIIQLRSDRAADNDNVYVRFNGDSTAGNYYGNVGMLSHSATWATTERLGVTATGIEIVRGATGNTSPAGYRAALTINIYNYADSARPRIVHYDGYCPAADTTGTLRMILGGATWKNTAAAINQITLLPVTGTNFVAGSSYALYGVS